MPESSIAWTGYITDSSDGGGGESVSLPQVQTMIRAATAETFQAATEAITLEDTPTVSTSSTESLIHSGMGPNLEVNQLSTSTEYRDDPELGSDCKLSLQTVDGVMVMDISPETRSQWDEQQSILVNQGCMIDQTAAVVRIHENIINAPELKVTDEKTGEVTYGSLSDIFFRKDGSEPLQGDLIFELPENGVSIHDIKQTRNIEAFGTVSAVEGVETDGDMICWGSTEEEEKLSIRGNHSNYKRLFFFFFFKFFFCLARMRSVLHFLKHSPR